MVNSNNAQFTYQATRITTATKEQLLLITYDIGIKACHAAENAMLGKNGGSPDYDLANRENIRAQEVIRELMVTLNRDKGGEMADKLMQLYEYMYQLLVDANMKKEPDNIRVVRGMLEELKATWESALVQLLQEYQAAHPEDKDLQNAILELEGKKPESAPTKPAAPTQTAYKAAAPAKTAKAGGFTLAG
ncbi:MAG: flagellar export chaperone FliS [Synergistaceae bacterium]|nr:flagellar export chaperone FliS [Synergistaceae bacterium]